MIKKIIKNKTGFTLIGVMVASGILGGLALGIMRFMETSSKSVKTIEANSELNLMHDQVLLFLKNPINCNATFRTRKFGLDNGTVTLVPLQKGLSSTGEVDPSFTGLGTEDHKIQLQGMRIYHPIDETTPTISRLTLPSQAPEIDGWWILVQFQYTKYASDSNQSSKIFGATAVSRYALMKFNNFQSVGYATSPEICNSQSYTIAGEGQEFHLSDGSTEWLGPCLNGDPANLIQTCTIL